MNLISEETDETMFVVVLGSDLITEVDHMTQLGLQGRAVDPRTPEHSGVEVPTPELFWGWILFWD